MRASSTARAVELDQPRRSPVREHRPEFRLFSLEAVRERLRGEAPASRFLDRPFASVQLLLLSMAGLLVLGRGLRASDAGRRLGIVLALAWVASPFTFLNLMANTNDGLVPLFPSAIEAEWMLSFGVLPSLTARVNCFCAASPIPFSARRRKV